MTNEERTSHVELSRPMRENPDLPVVPMVDTEVVYGGEWGRWMGSWGSARVDEYILPPNEYDPILFKSEGDVFDALEKCLPDTEFDALPEDENKCRSVYDALPWTKAIIVNIDLPD